MWKFKFNLYRIFDNFIVNENYPFIQFQQIESQLTYKFYTDIKNYLNKSDGQNILNKWIKVNPTDYLLFDSNMNKLRNCSAQKNERVPSKKK